ncbi:hypothetical protein GCM10023262_14790 [Bartonella pachyuromydis]|uniref:Uncharacterized protein n=1 Tax=Bartonella pachyuromydis TaxID=931097 RepID=A0ABP8VLW7_9HYPH
MYKNRCYMPFILYPPDMYDISGNSSEVEVLNSLELDKYCSNFVMYLSIPYCRIRCKACPYFVSLLPLKSQKSSLILENYVDVLIRDLKRHAKMYRWKNALLRAIYIVHRTTSKNTKKSKCYVI